VLAISIEVRRRGKPRGAVRPCDGSYQCKRARVRVRERAKQQGVDHAEHHRVRADAECECQQNDRREPRRPPHQSPRELQVLEQCLDQRNAALLANPFTRLLETAEFEERDTARFLGAHARALIVRDVHFQVGRELLGEFALPPVRRDDVQQTNPPRPQRPDHDRAPERNFARMAAVRSQSRVSCSTRLCPARVSL
jgi:hypothetical protein